MKGLAAAALEEKDQLKREVGESAAPQATRYSLAKTAPCIWELFLRPRHGQY